MTKKQISQKQLQANRHNAQKSTGPKTPEGKARSSQNALKHGLLARQILLNDDDPNENPEDFQQLLSDLVDELQPAGRRQSLCVQRIAVCYWRLRRAYRFEAQSLKRQRQEEFSPFEELAQTVAGRNPQPFARILPYEHQMKLLVRYETMIDRQLNKAMTQLQKLQANPLPLLRSSPTIRERDFPPYKGGIKGGCTQNLSAPNEPIDPPESEPQAPAPGALSPVDLKQLKQKVLQDPSPLRRLLSGDTQNGVPNQPICDPSIQKTRSKSNG
ncbi:MAG: hypothetical protein ACYTF1_19070 [Planctomycetota bacterium]|jgi:hypothetical protein